MGDNYRLNFYAGADYGLDSNYGDFLGYRVPAGLIGQATDPRTANQIKMTADKINTGGKVVEVQMVTPDVAESIPNQHLDEIKRLSKITGTELTLHGPLVEPTGVTRQGWNETQRLQAERQMQSAVDRGHKLRPDGNLVVTFHSSNGLPEPETIVKDAKGKNVTTDVWIVDERTGQFAQRHPEMDYLRGKMEDVKETVNKQNEEAWFKQLQGVSFHANQGADIIEKGLISSQIKAGKKEIVSKEELLNLYSQYVSGKAEKKLKEFGEYAPGIKEQMQTIVHGDIYLRDSYQDLQKLFNMAYYAAQKKGNKNDLDKLDNFRKQIGPYLKDIEDPSKINQLSEKIVDGISVLRSISPPKTFTPLKDFAIDKSSDTFGNIAFNSYKKFGNNSPIISIENPPAGSGLSRAEDLRSVIEASRKKFIEKAKSEGISEHEAKKQAEKLIGATWDVGHINMIRKFGYGEKELIGETEKIAPYVKHVHLSDNFGLEHTELPMGMGNVPTKEHLKLLDKYNKQAKKIIETGNWFQHFQTTPLVETYSALGSPIYPMAGGPYWNQISGGSGGYFSGQGAVLPNYNFQTYGSGFSNLPPELGGQATGKNRLSGAPME